MGIEKHDAPPRVKAPKKKPQKKPVNFPETWQQSAAEEEARFALAQREDATRQRKEMKESMAILTAESLRALTKKEDIHASNHPDDNLDTRHLSVIECSNRVAEYLNRDFIFDEYSRLRRQGHDSIHAEVLRGFRNGKNNEIIKTIRMYKLDNVGKNYDGGWLYMQGKKIGGWRDIEVFSPSDGDDFGVKYRVDSGNVFTVEEFDTPDELYAYLWAWM